MGDAVDATMKHMLRVCATVAVLVTAGAASTAGRGTEAPGTGGPVPAEFPPVIAALLTSQTSVEQDSATSLRYVQSIDGGDRRNVSFVLTPVRSYQPPPQTVPMKLDNGAAIYAQRDEARLLLPLGPQARQLQLDMWALAPKQSVTLLVDGDNETALRLYRSEGFEIARTRRIVPYSLSTPLAAPFSASSVASRGLR